jgi:hypothetical protein
VQRRTPRFAFWLPMAVDELPAKLAVCRNASKNGILMVSRSHLAPGTRVTLRLELPTSGDKRTLHGHVTRAERNDDDPEGLWPHRIAVEFDAPEPDLELLLRSIDCPATSRPPK